MAARVVRLGKQLLLVAALTACNNDPRALIKPGDADYGSVDAVVTGTHCPAHPVTKSFTLTVESPKNSVAWHYAMSPGDFYWVIDTTMPTSFPKGTSTYNVAIQFAPTHTGDQTALASVVLVDPNATSTIVDLKGRGVCEF